MTWPCWTCERSGLASERYLSTLLSRGIPARWTKADGLWRSGLDRSPLYATSQRHFGLGFPTTFRRQREYP